MSDFIGLLEPINLVETNVKIFTIQNGTILSGAIVETYVAKGSRVDILAILVGEEGQGCHLGILPVDPLPSTFDEWKNRGKSRIYHARISQTFSGEPILLETRDNTDDDNYAICVFRTKIGFQGTNFHTGDQIGRKIQEDILERGELYHIFADFPGKILCSGTISQGEAGKMGSGDQFVAIVPANQVFRTSYCGYLYDTSSEYYYIFRNGNVVRGFK